MKCAILDCYTDEAAGLGVPPYLGTYPRYIAGKLAEEPYYLTIDDLRLALKRGGKILDPKPSQKSDIGTYNLTSNYLNVDKILHSVETLYVIIGVHVPGKYLSATPGTLSEILPLLKHYPCKKILTGPVVYGTQLHGGKFREQADLSIFSSTDYSLLHLPYSTIKEVSLRGAAIIKQIPDLRMIEIETGQGCDIGKCSFCTEPLKNKISFRQKEDILSEIKEFYRLGARYFRLGKQTCFYTLPDAVPLLKSIRNACPDIKVLHIDNCNPVKVIRDKDHAITKAIVKYCSSGNVAAFGVESFDLSVVRENTLNTLPKVAYEAIKIINSYGGEQGDDGMPKFLPGINIIFGLLGESKKTHAENMLWLKKIYDDGLTLRRINIRQAAIFEGTMLFQKGGDKFLKKNKRYYWKWREDIRQNIDLPMLQRVVPKGSILHNCYAEIYDGNTTFLRQFGTYPLVIGVKKRVQLKRFFSVKVTGHMLRSITAEIVETND